MRMTTGTNKATKICSLNYQHLQHESENDDRITLLAVKILLYVLTVAAIVSHTGHAQVVDTFVPDFK